MTIWLFIKLDYELIIIAYEYLEVLLQLTW